MSSKPKEKQLLLSDHAACGDQCRKDRFGLDRRLNRLVNALRSPTTPTPLTIAFTGDWGTGKSSAMHWVQKQLKATHVAGQTTGFKTCWFKPWKYQDRESVLNALIAEVLIQTGAGKSILEELKGAGGAVWSFFANLVEEVGVGEAKVKLNLDEAPKAAVGAFKSQTKPHLGFTSAHEKVFQEIIKNNLETKVEGKKEPETLRLAIFIDDLDRCLPEVAIQILEAIKLFFDRVGVVFILGVDRDVVDRMMVRHYTAALGPETEIERQRVARKARQYLDKMFQVEIQVPPNDEQVAQFAQEEVQELIGWERLSEDRQSRINVALKYVAGINPRGVIRALNSAFMGATELLDDWPVDEKEVGQRQTAIARTVQERLLDTVLSGTEVATLEDDFHDAARHADGRAFFRDWSAVVQEQRFYLNKSDLALSSAQAISADRADEIASPSVETSEPTLGERIGQIGRLRAHQESEGPSGKELLIEIARRHPSYADLLTVAPLAAVLHIVPYGGEYPEATGTTTTSDQSVDDFELFCQAVARHRRILLEDLVREELRKSSELNLVKSDITDAEFKGIKQLRKLTTLYLEDAAITEISPLASCKDLHIVDLSRTSVKDISALAKKVNLYTVMAKGSMIEDLSPLEDLPGLTFLDIPETPVSNLSPLSRVPHLHQLDISGCPVKDLSPLTECYRLTHLIARHTKIAALLPLQGLDSLEFLDLGGTSVSDLTPLQGLTSLQVLDLEDTQVTDLFPLRNLHSLIYLSLSGTHVTDLIPLRGLKSLRQVLLPNGTSWDPQVGPPPPPYKY